jgi:fibronectin type 3 domain-containing protein
MVWLQRILFRDQGKERCRPLRKTHRPWLELLEDRLAPSVSVLGYRNNLADNGQNLNETILTPANVNVSTFGKLFTAHVDGQVYAQPLIVPNVNITTGPSPGTHNVAFVATEHDSLYAIDADGGQVLWHDSFINPSAGVTTVPSTDIISGDLTPEIGITGTPVIDPATNTLFLDAKTKEVVGGVNHYVQRLHAIDIGSGAEKFGGPVTIADTIFDGTNYTYVSGPYVFGSGDGSVNGKVTFNALRIAQRPGLTIYNGNVYLAFASHGDNGPYHGWLLSYNIHNLNLDGVFNATPNGAEGGVWQGGGKVVIDSQGFLYFVTGNGTFDTTMNSAGFPAQGDYGDSFVKLAVDPTTTVTHQNINGWGLKVVDYFTPFNQAALNQGDVDLGGGGPVILPDALGSVLHPHLLLGAGKEGRIYLIDRDNMGHYNPTTDHAVEEAKVLTGAFDTPAYLDGTFYYAARNGPGQAFSIMNGSFNPVPTSQTPDTFSYPGSSPTISANGNINRIVWVLDRATNQLRAYDARNLGTELYTSSQAPNGRDRLGPPTKFDVPTVANGKVYVGTLNGLLVGFGLLHVPAGVPASPANLTATAVSGSEVSLTWRNSDGSADSFSIEESTDGVHFSPIDTAGATATSHTVVGLQPSVKYTFRVRASNAAGASGYSNAASVTTTNGAGAGLDLSTGFGFDSNLLTLNGSAAINGSVLELADGQQGEASSAFSRSRLDVTSFSTQFSLHLPHADADGLTFVIQNAGPTALGAGGGNLGYGADGRDQQGIANSVAVKFDLYDNSGEGPDSTGLYLNGASPENVGSIDLSGSGINLHNGDVFAVAMSYDGAILKVTITDAATGASSTQSYAVDIPSTVGGGTAYVGFTGATGELTATLDVANWMFKSTLAGAPAAPSGLSAVASAGTQVALSWSAVNAGVSSFLVERKTVGGPYSQIADIVGTTTFLDSALDPGGQYSYRVRATNPAGTSPYSSEGTVTLPTPPLPPSNAQVVRFTSTEADLSWQDNATNEDGYTIFRKDGTAGTFALVATLPAGATSYNDTGLTPGILHEYHVYAFNVAGYSDDSGTTITTVPAGNAPGAPTDLTAAVGPDQVGLSWAGETDAISYNLYRSTRPDGQDAVAVQTGVTTTFFTDTGLAPGATYYYQVSAVGTGGEGTRSPLVAATTPKASPDFSGGFTGAAGTLARNGSARVNGSVLQLTDGGQGEIASAFTKVPVAIGGFATEFHFQITDPVADGFTFTLQRAGASALGPGGGGLGYGPDRFGGKGGIAASVAVKFDLYDNEGEGNNSTGLYVDGAAPTNTGAIDLGTSGIDLHSGHVFGVTMIYTGGVLTVTTTDTVTQASATQSYTVDIPGVIGGATAYIGFTAATGGLAARQTILDWRYTAGASRA